LDVHNKESISIAVLNSAGKVVMECVIGTKASTILQFIHGLGGDVHLTLGLPSRLAPLAVARRLPSGLRKNW
jgi:hypothetical protein